MQAKSLSRLNIPVKMKYDALSIEYLLMTEFTGVKAVNDEDKS